ncbi:MAG: RDD family protein [Bacteroidota bacterium]
MNSTQIRRCIAFVLDLVVIGIMLSILNQWISSTLNPKTYDLLGISFSVRLEFDILIYVCYFILFDLINNGATFGKQLTRIQVVDLEGFKLPKSKSLKRSLVKIISIVLLPIAILLFLFKSYYTLHDHYTQSKTIHR